MSDIWIEEITPNNRLENAVGPTLAPVIRIAPYISVLIRINPDGTIKSYRQLDTEGYVSGPFTP